MSIMNLSSFKISSFIFFKGKTDYDKKNVNRFERSAGNKNSHY